MLEDIALFLLRSTNTLKAKEVRSFQADLRPEKEAKA